MPGAPRPSKESYKIAFNILGVPANMQTDKNIKNIVKKISSVPKELEITQPNTY